MISVCMSAYNGEKYIYRQIKSILDQLKRDDELIIYDDASVDKTLDIIKSFYDPRIRLITGEENVGFLKGFQCAMEQAKGEYIFLSDQDDLWMPNKLEKQIRFMEENGYAFSYTNYEEIDVNGNKTGVTVTGPKKISKIGMFNYCWPGCLTVMYNAEKVGLIQIEDIKKNNDYAMWLKVCKKADCYLLDETLGQYRKGRVGSVSTHSIKTMIGWHFKLYHEAEGMGWIESLINTGRNLVFGFYKKKRYVRR